MTRPMEYEINFLSKKPAIIRQAQFGPLYNLKLEMIENKKKLARMLPPIPEWNKVKPSEVKTVPKNPEPSKPIPKKEPVASTDRPKVEVKTSKKEIAKKDPEPQSEESEEEEDSEEDDSDAGSEEDSEGEEGDSDGDEEDSDKSLEESEPLPKNDVKKELSKEEMIQMGYTENVPPEELEKGEKEKYIKKHRLLQLRLRQKYEVTQDKKIKDKLDKMIPLTINDSLEFIKNTYDDEIFELKVISTTQRYKEAATLAFGGLEWVGKKFDEDFFKGYAKFQLSNMDQYEEVLMELGEGENFISTMTPFQKLLWLFGTNSLMFAMAKISGDGSAALEMLSLVTGKTVAPKKAPNIKLD